MKATLPTQPVSNARQLDKMGAKLTNREELAQYSDKFILNQVMYYRKHLNCVGEHSSSAVRGGLNMYEREANRRNILIR